MVKTLEIKIREMTPSDLNEVNEIMTDIFNEYDRQAAMLTLEFHFKLRENGVNDGRKFWVAQEDGQVVGFAGRIHAPEDTFWLSWMGVDREYQERGIGRKLFEHVLDMANKSNAKIFCIECGSLPQFRRANEMYIGYGFEEKFEIDDYWSPGDNLILLARKI